jgi:hypothetical protein
MGELRHYSGEFLPELALEDFSKEALIDLIKLYSKLYMALDGFWYLSIKKRLGNEEALECDKWVWEKDHRFELKHLTQLLKIQGRGIEPFLKVFQTIPWSWNLESTLEISDPSEALITIRRCPTLEALEKEGEGRERSICEEIDVRLFQDYARHFNPEIQITPLKLPPRKDPGEIACQWRVSLP